MTLTAAQIAEQVRAGELTAVEVFDEALARIEAREGEINAFTKVLAVEARAEARAVDADPGRRAGALAGVPIAIKAQLDVAGQVTTFGGRGNSTPAAADCELVRRLRAAGAVIIGLTNLPEFGQFPFTESARFGQTMNPAAPQHTAGGSSGGSAAAVASGMVPVAIGTDGGGSIRVPAACCGVFGIKPSRGRVSPAPAVDSWLSLGTAGPIANTVEDAALVLSVISGNAPTDRYLLPDPTRPFPEAVLTAPRQLRIGVSLRPTGPGIKVDAAVAGAVRNLATRLAELGHQVTETDAVLPNQTSAYVPQMYAGLRAGARAVEHPRLLERRTKESANRAKVVASPFGVRRALADAAKATAAVDGLFERFDLLLTPTLACLPPVMGQLDGISALVATLRSVPMVVFTSMYNVTGHPACSLPAGRTRGGLPIGAQLVGPSGRDDLVLAVAAQIERELGWANA